MTVFTDLKPKTEAEAEQTALTYPIISGWGVATAPTLYKQSAIKDFYLNHANVDEKMKPFAEKIFKHPSIFQRPLVLDSLEESLITDRDQLTNRFETWSVKLADKALKLALLSSDIKQSQVDYLVTTTCTGYLCPGLSSHLLEKNRLSPHIAVADFVGMGCGAFLPAMEAARNFVRNHPGSNAAVVAVEICSACAYFSNEPDIIVTNALFSDGAAAAIISDKSNSTESDSKSHWQIVDHIELTKPEWRNDLRFVHVDGRLKNVLGKNVPIQASDLIKEITESLLSRNSLEMSDINHWALHPGGAAVLKKIEHTLGLQNKELISSWDILNCYGNLSSPSVLFVLDHRTKFFNPQKNDYLLMGSFGAGFSGFGTLLKRS